MSQAGTAIVRPVRSDDMDALVKLLDHVDPGMITMPQTPEAMEKRVTRSLEAFERMPQAPAGEAYFLVLEEAGEIIGTSSIFTSLGTHRPFYSYRIIQESKHSPETGVSVDMDMLHLVNDHHGDAELGTLFILPSHRGGGRGRLLSFARLMLIASEPVRFGPRVMAEIRGWTDDTGHSPFWEAVGRKFFHLDYAVADKMSAKDHRFISDLMPRYPVYADLLPDAAREVISKPHPGAEPAKALLETQGFRYNNIVDIFDAGPCVESFTDSIEIVRSAERMPASDWAETDPSKRGLLASAAFTEFSCTGYAADEPREKALARLGASGADEVLAFNFPEKRKWRLQS